jgi:hypothetical protein
MPAAISEAYVCARNPGAVYGVAAELLELVGRGVMHLSDLDKHPAHVAAKIAVATLDSAAGCYGLAIAALQREERKWSKAMRRREEMRA